MAPAMAGSWSAPCRSPQARLPRPTGGGDSSRQASGWGQAAWREVLRPGVEAGPGQAEGLAPGWGPGPS